MLFAVVSHMAVFVISVCVGGGVLWSKPQSIEGLVHFGACRRCENRDAERELVWGSVISCAAYLFERRRAPCALVCELHNSVVKYRVIGLVCV